MPFSLSSRSWLLLVLACLFIIELIHKQELREKKTKKPKGLYSVEKLDNLLSFVVLYLEQKLQSPALSSLFDIISF